MLQYLIDDTNDAILYRSFDDDDDDDDDGLLASIL